MMPREGVQYGFEVERKGARPSYLRQVHGNEWVHVEDRAHLARLFASPPPADASFTTAAGVTLHIFTADCAPLLLFSERPDGPVAAVHGGWRGASLGIVSGTLGALAPWRASLHAVLGPCILGCCFEVREDLVAAFLREGRPIDRFLERRKGKLYFHLDRFILEEELKGLPRERLHTEALRCTVCSTPSLPSFRRNRDTDPRLYNWIRKSTQI